MCLDPESGLPKATIVAHRETREQGWNRTGRHPRRRQARKPMDTMVLTREEQTSLLLVALSLQCRLRRRRWRRLSLVAFQVVEGIPNMSNKPTNLPKNLKAAQLSGSLNRDWRYYSCDWPL